jgi:hypothetical protein
MSRYTPRDPGVVGRLALAHRLEREQASRSRPPVADFLEGWVRAVRLDDAQARRAVAGIENQESRRYADRISEIIQHGGPWDKTVELCDYGRAHSIVTRTPRVLREAFRVDGSPLIEIDVASAQPLLLGVTVRTATAASRSDVRGDEEGSSAGGSEEGGAGEEGGGGGEGGEKGRRRPLSSIRHADLHSCMQTSDLDEYMQICETGRFYKELARTLRMQFSSPSERALVKVQAMRLIFGRHHPSRPAWRRFASRWPAVACYLVQLKRGDYRRVAHALQRAESSLMIEGVAGELMHRHPGTPVLTIHDSVLTVPQAEEVVKEVIRSVWRAAGAEPLLKVMRPAG